MSFCLFKDVNETAYDSEGDTTETKNFVKESGRKIICLQAESPKVALRFALFQLENIKASSISCGTDLF